MIFVCGDERLESEDRWREFLDNATQDGAWKAILELFDLARSLKGKRAAHAAKRLFALYDVGCGIYEQRFGDVWAPF